MRVKFVRLFFGPDSKRYRPLEVYDVPDDWEEKGVLPKGTIVLPDESGSIEANKDGLLNERTMAARNASALAAKTPTRVASANTTRPNRAAGEYAIGDSDEEKAESQKAERQGDTDEQIREQAAQITGEDKDDIDVEALKSSPETSPAKPTEDAENKEDETPPSRPAGRTTGRQTTRL